MPTLRGRLLGLTVEVEGPPDLLAAVADRVPPGWTADEAQAVRRWEGISVPAGTFVRRDDDVSLGTRDTDEAATLLLSDLELWVAEHTTEFVVVHAGVVAHGGRAIVLPGRSMRGKSTLTIALLRAGAAFLSDEYALLRPDGSVTAYPRPLSVRPREGDPSGAVRVPVSEFGAAVEPGPVPVGLVVELGYEPAEGLAMQSLSAGVAALALIDNAVAAQTQKLAVMRACTAVAAQAQGWSGTRGDAPEAAARLLELLSP